MHNVILAGASGTLLALAFPYPSLWPLAWVALVPLLVALSNCSLRAGFGLGYLFGMFMFGITLRWAAELDPEGGWVLWALFVLIEAFIPGLFGALAAWFERRPAGSWVRPLALAATWTVVEYLRAKGAYALTWTQLSYSQLPNGVMVQMADVTGALGVSFIIALVNACIAEAWLWREENGRAPFPAPLRGGFAGYAVLVGVCVIYGAVRTFTLPALTQEVVSITCVQPNVDPHEKWDPQRLARNLEVLEEATTRAATSDHAYLVVWPETAIPSPVLRDPPALQRIQALAARLQVNILVGATDRSPQGRFFNTAFLVDDHGQVRERYDKMHLVPFGEFLPLRSLLAKVPPFDTITDLTPGEAATVFKTPRLEFGTLICFESTFSDLSRDLVRAGAQMLFVITNDGWFNRTSAADHHLAMSAMRAIEQRMWVVQCGNTGVSAFIDPLGKAHKKTGLFVPASITMAVQPGSSGSIYQRFGDWFAWLVTAVFAGCLLWRGRSVG